jgi:hypothetical protein
MNTSIAAASDQRCTLTAVTMADRHMTKRNLKQPCKAQQVPKRRQDRPEVPRYRRLYRCTALALQLLDRHKGRITAFCSRPITVSRAQRRHDARHCPAQCPESILAACGSHLWRVRLKAGAAPLA